MTDTHTHEPSQQELSSEVQRLRLVLDNLLRKGAQKDARIADLEVENAMLMNQLQAFMRNAQAAAQEGNQDAEG